jgi:xylan 1,4-beta-xylosidase
MTTELFNPLLPGLNPDPSIVRVGADFFAVTSTFEYLPGLPVYRSTDFETWTQIGNVATRPEQLGIGDVPTHLGVYAPTLRHHDGLFHLIVTIVGGRGCVVFTAEDPAGEWSDGTLIDGLQGIDPDLAWDEDGSTLLTYSGVVPTEDGGQRGAILQVSVDLAAGRILDEPRELWSGTGLKFPEAPHLYQREGAWYLLIAEGGTERGHAVSIARSDSPRGPFEGAPANPVLSARSTSRPIQNTGHADLVELPDGSDGMVLLGMRPLGRGQAYSILGRETFATRFSWVDGWPVVEPVALRPRPGESVFRDDFDGEEFDPGWMAVRRTPAEVASRGSGVLVLTADRGDLDGLHPAFIGRRQSGVSSDVSVEVDAGEGTGGLSIRFDEQHHYDFEVDGSGGSNRLAVRARLSALQQTWTAELPAGPLLLRIESSPREQVFPGDVAERMAFIAAPVDDAEAAVTVAEIDGRYLSAEVVVSFTGRVLGPYCSAGTAAFRRFEQRGTDISGGELS